MEVNCKYIKKKHLSKFLSQDVLNYYKGSQNSDNTGNSSPVPVSTKRKSIELKANDFADQQLSDVDQKKRKLSESEVINVS